MASITVRAEGAEQHMDLEAATVTIGRGLESDVRLKDIKASRRHCQIVKTPQGFEIVDLSSGNGTFVNGVQIKQKKLASGDKIQIGSTTITFIDGEGSGRAAPAKAAQCAAAPTSKNHLATPSATKPVPRKATGSVPTASKPAGATTRTGAARPATSQLPVAPTKKITTGVPAARPSTQSMAPARPATRSIDKPSTTSLKKGATQRVGQTTRSTAYVSATQRFYKEASRKKVNPVAVIIGLIVVALGIAVALILFGGGAVALILFGGGEDNKLISAQLEKKSQVAAKAYQEDRLDEALALYGEMLKLIEGRDAFKRQVLEIRNTIREINERRDHLAVGQKEFEELVKRFDTSAAPPRQLLEEFRKFQDRYPEGPWVQEVEEKVKRINRMIDTEVKIREKMEFQVKRNEVIKECSLADRSKANFSLAVKLYKEYIDSKPGEQNVASAQKEITNLGIWIAEEINDLRRRAERLEKKEEAIAMLKDNRSRFEGTEGEEQLEKLIREVEKR